MPDYFNKQGDPITMQEYVSLEEIEGYKQVAYDELDNGTHISTVWLGFDHGYGPGGPIIFETLVANSEWEEQEMYRYCTEEEALKHHKHLVDTYYDEREPISRWKQVTDEI